jgi:glycosyltransferase involved in cell wall biosynthesis
MKNIIITVIIPNYNYGRYLEACLQSVLESGFTPEQMEIVVVDDASTDDSIEVVAKFKAQSRFPVTLIANKTNIGVTRSRNLGIVHASGEFLFFLDADNYIHKECLKIESTLLRNHPDATACYAPIREFLSDTGEECGLRSDKPFDFHQLIEMPYIDAMAMFRRSDIIQAGMYDIKMPPYGWEDYELWLRLGKLGKKVLFIPGEPLSYFRIHRLNKSQNYQPDQFNQLVYFLKHKYGILVDFLPTETLKKLIHFRKENVQLYYQDDAYDFDEKNSIVKNIEESPFIFRLPSSGAIRRLRFDPFNDYIVLNFKDIQFFHHRKEVSGHFKIISNACEVLNTTWYFTNKDPQITIEFAEPLHIDEIVIEADYVVKGEEVIEELEKIFQCKSLKIKFQSDKIENLQAQLIAKGAEQLLVIQTLAPVANIGWLEKAMLKRNIRLIGNSGFFDIDYYLQNNPDVNKSGMDACKHFLLHGGFEKRNPSEKFDTEWYLRNNPDVSRSGMNPLLHYIRHGKSEGREPKNPSGQHSIGLPAGNDPVSIVMPAYNAQTTIAPAIRSLQRQSYKELEIIVIDDGSDDNTVRIVEKLASDDDRIKITALPENRGCYVSRNQGIREAKGKYITFHDADDIAMPDRIESQLFAIKAGNVRFSVPGFMRTRFSIDQIFNCEERELNCLIENEKKLSDSASNHFYELRPCLSMTLFAREIFEKHGLFWTTRFAADAEFIERILARELGATFNAKKNELRTFIMQEKRAKGLYAYINRHLILSPETGTENVTVKYPMGGLDRERFMETWKKRLVGIGDYTYPTL